jgi:hypothetical protein
MKEFGIAIGVLLAVILGNIAITEYQLYKAGLVMSGVTDSLDRTSRHNAEISGLRVSIANLTRANRKLRQDLASAQKDLKAYKAVKSAKQQAFAKYHTDSEDCLIFDGDAHMVECQNVKMRAKKEFERLWQSGQRSF